MTNTSVSASTSSAAGIPIRAPVRSDAGNGETEAIAAADFQQQLARVVADSEQSSKPSARGGGREQAPTQRSLPEDAARAFLPGEGREANADETHLARPGETGAGQIPLTPSTHCTDLLMAVQPLASTLAGTAIPPADQGARSTLVEATGPMPPPTGLRRDVDLERFDRAMAPVAAPRASVSAEGSLLATVGLSTQDSWSSVDAAATEVIVLRRETHLAPQAAPALARWMAESAAQVHPDAPARDVRIASMPDAFALSREAQSGLVGHPPNAAHDETRAAPVMAPIREVRAWDPQGPDGGRMAWLESQLPSAKPTASRETAAQPPPNTGRPAPIFSSAVVNESAQSAPTTHGSIGAGAALDRHAGEPRAGGVLRGSTPPEDSPQSLKVRHAVRQPEVEQATGPSTGGVGGQGLGAPSPSPVQQISVAIAAEARPQTASVRLEPSLLVARGDGPQPVRVLVLQLHPAELGGVTLRIALKGNALDLQIEADKGQTARLLNDDREALSSLLRTAGYAVDTVTVRAVEVSPAASQVGASSGSGVGDPQPQFRGSQPDVGHSRGQEQGQDRNHQRPNRIGNEGQDTSHTGSGDGIYV